MVEKIYTEAEKTAMKAAQKEAEKFFPERFDGLLELVAKTSLTEGRTESFLRKMAFSRLIIITPLGKETFPVKEGKVVKNNDITEEYANSVNSFIEEMKDSEAWNIIYTNDGAEVYIVSEEIERTVKGSGRLV